MGIIVTHDTEGRDATALERYSFLKKSSFRAPSVKIESIVERMVFWGRKTIGNMFKHYFMIDKIISDTSGMIKLIFSGSE